MKRKILVIILLSAIIVGGFFAWNLFLFMGNQERDAVTLYGNVDIRQVDLSFRVSGRIESLLYEEGDLIEQGELVAILEKQPYEDLVRQSKASVSSAKASLENAKLVLKRRIELISDGSVSQEDLDNAQANQDIQAANLKASKAELDIALSNLDYTHIYAPSQGTILTRVREPGTVVNPTDPVYVLSVSSPVWIRAFVSEVDLGLIYPGMEAQIMTDTPNGKTYTGKIGFISPVAEFTPKTVETTQLRTDLVYRLRIYADNPDSGLKQGMPVTVVLPLK